MSSHATITPEEAADRLAIRELINAYAHFADRRQAGSQAALYAPEARTLVYTADPSTSEPVQVLVGRDAHVEGFMSLNQYVATTHFNGQSTIDVAFGAGRATGETYCLAHHLLEGDDGRKLILMSIRYEDTFAEHEGEWLFAERKLIIDWTDTRPSVP
ncbi:nuclear transport factor 2 family protein [Streptomyces sp. NPDC001714]|uniref:nuclear transport factor 2 family protein n=1 Tax=Streptomyces sp. NPDC001714 TaxID=3364603 RepID=UPI00368DB500